MNDILEISADGTTLTKVLDNSITHLSIPNGVSGISRRAFKECIYLESVDIPDTLIDIDIVSLLGGCKSLVSINVGDNNRNYKSIDGILYSKDLTKIIFVPRGKKMENFSIPDNVSEIGYRAFSRCNGIVSIVIPNTVIRIDRYAFFNCESLQAINIPDFITEIGGCSNEGSSINFEGCLSLRSIFIPENIVKIDEYAFYRCTSLQEIVVHKRNRSYTSVDGILYSKDLSRIIIVPIGKKLKQFTVPKEVKHISGFQHCVSLEEIIISQNVKSIESYTFSGCISLKKVTVLGHVGKIEMNTFEDCNSLCDITLPDGIKYIDHDAFSGCISLQNIEIPNSVVKIECSSFSKCKSLKTIKVGEENSVFSTVHGVLYSKDLKKIFRVPQNAKMEDFTILDGITEIGDCAFDECTSLHYIDIPNSVVRIGDFAFQGCINLSSINIPESVQEIGDNAFDGCVELKEVQIPNTITRIGDHTFRECTSLHYIDIPNSVVKIGDSAFAGCINLSSINIPESVQEIGDNAFDGCVELKEVQIPMNIFKMGYNAFKGTEWYKSIMSEDTDFVTVNKYLMEYKGDKDVVEILIPFGIIGIGYGVFRGCKELKHVELPNSVITIGEYAFYKCTSIETIDIPNSVVEIGESAFSDCTSLQDIDIPNSVKRIGCSAFSGCVSLKEIDLPAYLEVIEGGTFNECTALERISIPYGVIKIADGSLGSLGRGVFDGCKSLKSIQIPDSVNFIGRKAFHNSGIEMLSIPKSVKWIGEHALCNCALKSIEVSEDNHVYSSVDGVLYCYHEILYIDGVLHYIEGNKENGIKSIIKYPPQKDGETFVLNEKVIALSSCAFKNADKLKEIVLHQNVRCLGEQQTFATCSSLRKITIPPIWKIPRLAFSNCSSLEELNLPHTDRLLIEKDAFEKCSVLNTIRAYAEKTDSINIEDAFEKTIFDKCILYIPSGSRWAYKHHPEFGRFKTILVEKEMTKEKITYS